MTEKEIIQALGSERYMAYGGHHCIHCKYRYKKGEGKCGERGCRIAGNALQLILRLQDENEQLREEKPIFYCERVEMSEAEIETFNNRPMKLVVTKHTDNAELLTAENELLNVKIERLEKELANSKAVATKLDDEVKQQDAEIERLKETIDGQDVEIMRLKHELDHQKAIASAELDSLHSLGDDYERALEDEQKHIREAKVEAVKEVGKMLMDKCHDGIICAVDVLDIVCDYMNERV